MSRHRLIALLLVGCLARLLPGCSSADPASPRAEAPAGPTTTASPGTVPGATPTGASYDGPRIPDSTWTKVVTEAQARDAGLDAGWLASNVGSDGVMPLTLRFLGDTWSITIGNDAGAPEVGDVGDVTYDEQGRLVTTSRSEGCPGCVATQTWSIAGDRLWLRFLGDSATADARLVAAGTWRRSS